LRWARASNIWSKSSRSPAGAGAGAGTEEKEDEDETAAREEGTAGTAEEEEVKEVEGEMPGRDSKEVEEMSESSFLCLTVLFGAGGRRSVGSKSKKSLELER